MYANADTRKTEICGEITPETLLLPSSFHAIAKLELVELLRYERVANVAGVG